MMPKMTKNMSITTETLTMAPTESATDLSTARMPLDFVNARSGRTARRIRSERTALIPPADVIAYSKSVDATMNRSSWLTRCRANRRNPKTTIFSAHSEAKHAVRQ